MKIYHSQGFTLIELLMVVSILSATAYVALNTLENDTNQIRYKDTENRLVTVRNALLGQQGSVYNGQRLLSGYVADNGALPPRCDTNEDGNADDTDDYALCVTNALLVKPENYKGFENQSPRFDSSPDAVSGINDDAALDVVQPDTATDRLYPEFLLQKGYRSSGYLSLKPGVDDYLDGWGHAWRSDSSPSSIAGAVTDLTLISLGQNNLEEIDRDGDPVITDADSLNLYDTEIHQRVDASKWQVDVAGWDVTVTNVSGVDIHVADPGCLRLSLLVFVNAASTPDTDDKRWKRLTSECMAAPGAVIPPPPALPPVGGGSCIDGDGDNQVSGLACPSSVRLVFPMPSGGTGLYQPATLIPQGEHLLLLVIDTDAADAHADASESPAYFHFDLLVDPAVSVVYPHTDAARNHSTDRSIGQRIPFYSGAARPLVNLLIY